MRPARTLVFAVLVVGAARAAVGCAEDGFTSLDQADAAPEPDSSVVASPPVVEDGGDDDVPEDGSADAGVPCSRDGFCHTRLPGRDTFDAGDLAPDLDVSFDLVDVSVAPGGAAWAVTTGGHLLEWRDEAWSVAYVAGTALRKVWAASADDVWFAGNSGFVMHGTRAAGAQMVFEDAKLTATLPVLGLVGFEDEIWAYANNVLYRHASPADGGAAWIATPVPVSVQGTSPAAQLTGLWRGPTGQVWLAGRVYNSCFSGCVYVSRPAIWKRATVDSVVSFEEIPFTYDAVSYTGVIASAERADRPFACIGQPCSSVLQPAEDGSTSAELTGLSEGQIEAAWASGPDEAWLVGSPGVVRRWNGTEWTYARVTVTNAPIVKPLHAVSGYVDASGAIDMWIVGKDTALHRKVTK